MMRYLRIGCTIAAASALTATFSAAHAQYRPWPSEPFRATGEQWGTLPNGLQWGATSTIDAAPDGRTMWVAERCGVNDCTGNTDRPTIYHLDLDGNVLHSFGQGLINWPHGFHVDQQGNVWVADGRASGPQPIARQSRATETIP